MVAARPLWRLNDVACKAVIIGGGSFLWTERFAVDLFLKDALRGSRPQLLARAEAMVSQGPAEIIEKFHDFDQVYVWRARIAKMITTLRSAKR